MFWENFVSLCEKVGEKPTPLTKKLGFAHGSVTRWKNGSVPNGKTLSVIAEYFGVSTDYLLGKTEERSAPSVSASSEKLQKLNELLKDVPDYQLDSLIDFLEKFLEAHKSEE